MSVGGTDAEQSDRGGLAAIVDSHRVVVCVGSGGVGKTTTAAAVAVHAALAGKRVLCLTIDPAHRLANSLGLDKMMSEEQTVPRELFEAHGLELRGHLSAMMLDTKRTFDQLVERYASTPAARDRILGNRLYQYMSSSLAGTSEYMAMEKLHAVREDPSWDLIVLDTPPTANALDFLSAPERMVGLVDSPAMRWFMQAFESTGKVSFNIVGKGAALLLKGVAKFTGAEFLAHLAELVSDLNDLFGGFRERAQQVAQHLRSSEVAFVLVTSPRPLAIEEAIFFHERLTEVDIGVAGFVVNGVRRLLPEPSGTSRELGAALESALARGGAPESPAASSARLLDTLQRALDDERVRAVADRIQAERLANRIAKTAHYVEVPAFDRDVHDLGALARVASYLVSEQGAAVQ
jgi:anion-transporting  ArsA/GET3 family ATPase